MCFLSENVIVHIFASKSKKLLAGKCPKNNFPQSDQISGQTLRVTNQPHDLRVNVTTYTAVKPRIISVALRMRTCCGRTLCSINSTHLLCVSLF